MDHDAVILGSAIRPFKSFIAQLMSAANEQRSHAVSLFKIFSDLHPDALVLKLTVVLQISAPDLRAISVILLRDLLAHSDSDTPFWPRLNPASLNLLKSRLISALRLESVRSTAKKVADTISALAVSLLPDSTWPDLLPFLFRTLAAASDTHPGLQEYAFLIFGNIAHVLADDASFVGSHHHTVLNTHILAALNHSSSPDVRVAALSAAVNLVTSLKYFTITDPTADLFLADLLFAMMKTLTDSLGSATTQEVLKLLVELADAEPLFFYSQIDHVVKTMIFVADGDGHPEGTRFLAIEFLTTFTEAFASPSEIDNIMHYKTEFFFLRRLFDLLMKMLLDLEDDPAWYTVQGEDVGETRNYSVAQEYLNRLAIVVGELTSVLVIFELLPSFLSAPEWKKRHAVLIAFAQIPEGFSKMILFNLDQVVTTILSSFQDPHPRVRWAAINVISQFSTCLRPYMQDNYSEMVLSSLKSIMNDSQNPPRVQAHAVSAYQNFRSTVNLDENRI